MVRISVQIVVAISSMSYMPIAIHVRSSIQGAGTCAAAAVLSDAAVYPGLTSKDVIKHPSGASYRTHILTGENNKGRDKLTPIKLGVWEAGQDPQMQAIFESDPNCTRPIFVDGGAAFGYYSVLAMRQSHCREVQAFNPHPKFAYAMRQNVEDNIQDLHLSAAKVCINRVALSGADSTMQMPYGYGGSIGKLGPETVQVPVTSLDIFFRKHIPADKKVLMVKLDIEGEELNAMAGARALLRGCRVKHWVIGIHRKTFVEPIVSLLKENGYRITAGETQVPGQPNGLVMASC